MSQVSWTKAWKMTGTGTSYCFLCMSTKEFWMGWAHWGTPMSCHPHKGTFLKHEPPNPIGANLLKRSLPRDQLLRSFWPGPFGQLCCGRPQKIFANIPSATVKICKCEWCVWFANGWKVYISCVYFWTIYIAGLPRKSSNDICIASPIISLCLPLITPNFTVSVHQRMQFLVCVGKGFSGGLENHDCGGFYINSNKCFTPSRYNGYRISPPKKKTRIQLIPDIDIGKRL